MNFLHQDLGTLDPSDIVEVTLDHPPNVQILDPANCEAYKNGKPFRYHGGYVTQPVLTREERIAQLQPLLEQAKGEQAR